MGTSPNSEDAGGRDRVHRVTCVAGWLLSVNTGGGLPSARALDTNINDGSDVCIKRLDRKSGYDHQTVV